MTAGDAAALVRCAAAAPRLPTAAFGSLGLRLLRTHGSAAEGEGVRQALVALSAAHGSQHHTGLASLVPELLSGRAFQAASGATQLCLLRRLPQLLAALPDAEAARALAQVARMVSGTDYAGNERCYRQRKALLQLLLSLATLLGSVGSAGGGSAADGALQGAAASTLEALLLQPRVMPLPGAYAQLLAVAAGATGGDGIRVGTQPSSLADRCWAAALRCLQQLLPAQRDALLRHPALPPAAAAFAAAALVAAGVADARLLQHPRNLLLQGDFPCGTHSSSTAQQALAALHLGRGVARLPPGAQQQWLLEVLDACKVGPAGLVAGVQVEQCSQWPAGSLRAHPCTCCGARCLAHVRNELLPPAAPVCAQACENPGGAFQLAACITASSAAVAAATGEAPQLCAELAVPAGTAAEALPFTLPRLLATPTWRGSSAGTALLLQRLVAAANQLAAAQMQIGGSAPTSSSPPVGGWQVQLRCCLLAVRTAMPADCWPVLASLL